MRCTRWLSTDALEGNYPNISPYSYALNNPIYFVDIDGNIIYDKNGIAVVIKYEKDGIVIVNESSIDPNTVAVLKKTYEFSSIGKTTIRELDAKDVKHQVYVSSKKGIFKEDGKYGNIAGLEVENSENEEGKSIFIDEKGGVFDTRIYLFNTEDIEITEDNILFVDEYGLVANESQTSKAAKKIAKQGLELNRETHEATAQGVSGISEADSKVLNKIDALSDMSKFFGWLTTLIHENVHAQGDPTENNSYQKEIDSFKEANE